MESNFHGIFCKLLFIVFANSIHCFEKRDLEQGGRILNGTFTSTHKHSYFSSVEFSKTNACGGALISPNVVLTSQNCIEKYFFAPNSLTVRLGSTALGQGGSLAEIEKTINHPGYDSKTQEFDAALLVLKKSYYQYATIQMPTVNEDLEFDGTGTLIGYGDDSKYASRLLHEMNVVRMPDEFCNKYNKIHSSQFCTVGVGPCAGFEGGPFVHKKKVFGIYSKTSFGDGSPMTNIFTKVVSLLDWINSEGVL